LVNHLNETRKTTIAKDIRIREMKKKEIDQSRIGSQQLSRKAMISKNTDVKD
jgi:hypothetical protein